MTGQAIDAAFPDIPLKQLRWSAAIREVGGIGYYPTSGIPFVHVDTGPVRAWPRLPRSELALLFPDGRTKHQPADGGAAHAGTTCATRARQQGSRHAGRRLLRSAQPSQVAEIEIAQAEAGIAPPAPTLRSPPTQVARPAPEARIAAFETEVFEATPIEAPAPKLVQAPRPATPPPSDAERGRLNQLVTLASLSPTDVPAQRLQTADADRYQLDQLVEHRFGRSTGARAALAGAAIVLKKRNAGRLARPRRRARSAQASVRRRMRLREGWAPAPEFDEDHPEELSYRPFPIAPLLTAVGLGRRRGAGEDRASQPRSARSTCSTTSRSCCRCGCGPAIRSPRCYGRSSSRAVPSTSARTRPTRTRGGQRPHLAPRQDDGALSGRVWRGFLRPGGTQPFDQATLMSRPSSRKSSARGDVARQARPTVR